MNTSTATYIRSASSLSDGAGAAGATSVDHGPAQAALHNVRRLVSAYVALSILTLLVIAVLRDDNGAVNSAVWTRGAVVMASSLVSLSFVLRAASGSRRAFLRLRIASAVMVVAIAAIVASPGSFPVWLTVEQGVCGLLLLGVAVLVNGRHLRSHFASR